MRTLSGVALAVTFVLAAGCGSSGSTSGSKGEPGATTGRAVIDVQSFGMHVLGLGGHAYPALPFGSVRVWDMGVTWKDLQPTPTTPLTGDSNPALARLDAIVSTFTQHGAEPMITLGMTPDWAANSCRHVVNGTDWGVQTCAPRDTSIDGPWGRYVKALASRYSDKVKYFETWNEPSLHNGYNDDIATLAKMQKTAYDVLHSLHHGQQLVSPGVPFTNGPPTNGLNWLSSFFAQPGGTSFDIVGLHLYPADANARAGDGPEWAVDEVLPQVRQVLAAHGLSDRPIWNTETNVGRAPAHTGYQDTVAGAAAVARTYILATENGIARTMWYAADDRTWGGTWLTTTDSATPSTAGRGYITVEKMLEGTSPLGCDKPASGTNGMFTCRFGDGSGKLKLVVMWTTGSATKVPAPAGTTGYLTVTGVKHSAKAGAATDITDAPVYFTV